MRSMQSGIAGKLEFSFSTDGIPPAPSADTGLQIWLSVVVL